MCDYFSAIVTKEGEILTDNSDSHSEIIKKNNLSDNCKVEDLTFYPIEILPNEGKNIWDEPTKENWYFNLGASRGYHAETPKWWKKSFENKCWKFFIDDWNKRFLVGKEFEKLTGDFKVIKDCKIKTAKKLKVEIMCGSSQVGEMCDSSQVGEMWDSSQVGEMQSRYTTIRIFGINVKLPKIQLGVIINFSKDKTEVKY